MTLPEAPRPWWHAGSGALVALAIALGSGWLAEARRDGAAAATSTRVDREMDGIERRLSRLEDRCR